MEIEAGIAKGLAILETIDTPTQQPAIVVAPYSGEDFILGNAAGLTRLAIAALKAARGEPQSFKNEGWVFAQDIDWAVNGLRLDTSAHRYLPEKASRRAKITRAIYGWILLGVVGACLLVGTVTILGWLFSLIHIR